MEACMFETRLLSPAETLRLAGGRLRFLNPFRSLRKGIEAATEGDPVLRMRAFASERHTSALPLSLRATWHIASAALALCVMGMIDAQVGWMPSGGLENCLTVYALLLATCHAPVGLFVMTLISIEEVRMHRACPAPLVSLRWHGTGVAELDDILFRDAFELEHSLRLGGMDDSDIEELNELGLVLEVIQFDRHCLRHASSMISAGWLSGDLGDALTARAKALMSRARRILGENVKGSEVKTLAAPELGLIDVLRHSGIDVEAAVP